MLLSFVGGLVVGFWACAWRQDHQLKHYRCKAEKAIAYVDALKSSISVLTNKVQRMEKAGVHDSREATDAGLMDGIRYVLKEKLSKAEY